MLGFINLIITLLILIFLSIFFGASTVLAQGQTSAPSNAETLTAENAIKAETLTLESAIELAVKSSRMLQNAEIDVDKAKDRTAAYSRRRFPQFKVTTLISHPMTGFD